MDGGAGDYDSDVDPGPEGSGDRRDDGLDMVLAGIDDAINRLADIDAEDEMDALGRMLEALVTSATGALGGSDVASAALKRLREARDLLDDGEPADTVALELMAARDLLRRR